MPQVKRARPTRAANNGRRGVVDQAGVTPEEIASVRASVEGKQQAPSTRQQSGINLNWSRVRDQLGDPFDVERIPISRLRFMRRDPMLGFGLAFIKTAMARAKWHINATDTNGPNAEVAANVDWALRRIFAGYVFQWANILDFGFSGIAKRYEARIPTGTFIDPGQGDGTASAGSEVPLWSQGGIQPIVWKPFIALSPEVIEPIWNSQGDFDGILYKQEASAGAGSATGDKNEFKIDVFHALWATHEKDSNFGSLFGYPRLGYAYRYWWSYWFRWAIADQAFEKKSDPGLVVRHPDGEFEITPGQLMSYSEYALDMGERLRAGATISLPSEVYMGEIDGKPSAVPLWSIEPMKDLIDFKPFDDSFGYLDIMKLRCVTADTPIDCPRDHELHPDGVPISEIKDGQLIWCFNEKTETFELRPVKKVGKTRPNAELLLLTLDTGKKIRATPDHKFMRRDGTWVELQNLKPGDSLMPLQRDFEPYVRTKPNERGWSRKPRVGREMDLVAEAAYGIKGKGINVHHDDDRHCNTSPENLSYLTNSEHTKLTNTGTRRPPGQYEKVKAGYAERVCECGQSFAPRGPTSKLCDTCQGESRFASASELSKSRRSSDRVIANRAPRICESCGNEYQPTGNSQKWCEDCRAKQWLESKADPVDTEEWISSLSNHKVVSVQTLRDREDTWDLSVDGPPECHSFVVHGVVAHNSLWIPEQAFLEGKGGTSSRNVAAEMSSSFQESQAVLAAQLVESVNRWIIPQFLATNFPEFTAANGVAEIIMEGFGDQDVEARNLMFQLLGQQDFGARKLMGILDIKKIAEDAGLPILSFKEQQAAQAEIVAEQQAANAPTGAIAPAPGQSVGIVPSATGFSYIQPREIIYLSDTTSEFLERLPSSKQYTDAQIRRAAREMWQEWHGLYADEYDSFADYLVNLDGLEAAEPEENIRKLARRIVRDWESNLDRLGRVMDRTASIYKKVLGRASKIEAKKSKLADVPSEEALDLWVQRHAGEIVPTIEFTTREELTAFLAARLSDGVEDPKVLAGEIREHFADFPGWKADRLARCLPGETLVDGAVVRAVTRRWYEGTMATVVMESEREFTATPNHPMLTTRGWVGAGEVQEGDYFIRRCGQQDASVGGDPDVANPPSSIAEIYESTAQLGSCERRTGTEFEFHGDGIEGKVDIARPDSELRVGDFTPLNKHVVEGFLSPTSGSASAFCSRCGTLLGSEARGFCGSPQCHTGFLENSDYELVRDGVGLADRLDARARLVSEDDELLVNVGSVSGMTQVLEPAPSSIGSGTQRDALAAQFVGYDTGIDSQALADTGGAQTVEVELDRVVECRLWEFSGYVYNLCTEDGYFTSDAYYTGNTEIREAYNGATLLTAMQNGADKVQAIDGTGDKDCAARNGEVFEIEDAMAEREHPNGTLAWRILPVALSWEYTDEETDQAATYFPETETVYFSAGMDDDERADLLLQLGDALIAGVYDEEEAA